VAGSNAAIPTKNFPRQAKGAYLRAMTDTPDAFNVDSFEHVKTLLKVEGIEANEADLASLAKLFPSLRRKIDRFYEVETSDEVTASVFRADSDS